ncbi:MAG: alanine--tRNA ligase [Syntrophorhabdaceae bacterium]|nr:alanine--tRNA ligase [Syntrophorhabdaceae bacterium]
MTSKEIRKKFLDFFSSKGHTIVPSSSLVPDKDPSLLFVNAGMVQFKNVFLGIEKRPYERATSSQKCVRAGGKHNDLENVGKTLRHHTFFEMLGNFSFGNYFKKEAIGYAWEFLRDVLNLDPGRLWVTVYKDDDDAVEFWKKVGFKGERIVRLGEKDNFWSMGDEGPCGPCSEIIYDLGDEIGCRRPECKVGCDCDRFLEIWNLVFMEYERSRDGEMKRLPRPSIDTGMGLERITSVLQGKIGNYETDLFQPIISKIGEISGCAYGENERFDIAIRVIADHIRGAVFIINDGVLPSKEGRGYVLRRIIRRALRYGKKIGIEKEFLYNLSSVLVDIMEDVYPEIKHNHPYIVRVLKGEEERFVETLSMGMKIYEDISDEVRSKGMKILPGELVYKLYDTYGFPVDITREMAEEDGLTIDMEGFQTFLEEQKERSRVMSRIAGETLNEGHAIALKKGLRNDFVGYDTPTSSGIILMILKEGEPVDMIGEGETGEFIFDNTPFYAESGGQVADGGAVYGTEGGEGEVKGVTKIKEDLFAHSIYVKKSRFRVHENCVLKIDEKKRRSIARNHTATHLLQYALREVLGPHVRQSGSLVESDRLRFDFTHFQAMDEREIASVEDIVNRKIMECLDVVTVVKSREEAIREGATALFEEKYGDFVRVVKISDISSELCGGTHVGRTGEIGSFSIISESSLASGVRRIEAVTGEAAVLYNRTRRNILNRIARITNTEPGKVLERIESILEQLKEKEKEIEKLKGEALTFRIDEAISKAQKKNGISVVKVFTPDARVEDLRKVADIIRSKVKSFIALVGTTDEEKGTLIVATSKDIQNIYKAGDIVRRLTEKYGGKGGGSPHIAQGGIPAHMLMDAMNDIETVLGEKI